MTSVLSLLVLAAASAAAPRAPQPERPLPELFASADYPAAALARAAEGRAEFRLAVDPRGRIGACVIVASSGHEDLDAATCRILTERARFRPAFDRRGRPVAGSHVGRVVWRMARIPFAERVRAVEVDWAGDEARCRRREDAQPIEIIVGAPCLRLAGPVAALARRAGPGWRGSMREILRPDDAAPAGAGRGEHRLFETEATLRIAADGRVLACEIVRTERIGPLGSRLPDVDNCRAPLTSGVRFVPNADRAERRARILFTVDLQPPGSP
jgi:TonB family protein